jgi:hypothetical protein
MRFHRFLLLVVLTGLSTAGFAESDAQKSFTSLKTLAGSWQGTYDGKPVQVSLRVTSMGNTLMHEMTMGEELTTRSPCFTWKAIACC